jgi:hypothetical protein
MKGLLIWIIACVVLLSVRQASLISAEVWDGSRQTGNLLDVPDPDPAIDIEKYVGIGGDPVWYDADESPGPEALVGDVVWFWFVITNTGNVTLTDITLDDSEFDDLDCDIATELIPDGVTECIIGPMSVMLGQHSNTATATGQYDGQIVEDSDSAHYLGVTEFIPTDLAIEPTGAIVRPGQVVTFRAIATDDRGNWCDVTSQTEFSIDAGAGGFWVGNLYTSEVIGTWAVTGQYNDLAVNATVDTVRSVTYLPLVVKGAHQ